jgi:hypothetical protein
LEDSQLVACWLVANSIGLLILTLTEITSRQKT